MYSEFYYLNCEISKEIKGKSLAQISAVSDLCDTRHPQIKMKSSKIFRQVDKNCWQTLQLQGSNESGKQIYGYKSDLLQTNDIQYLSFSLLQYHLYQKVKDRCYCDMIDHRIVSPQTTDKSMFPMIGAPLTRTLPTPTPFLPTRTHFFTNLYHCIIPTCSLMYYDQLVPFPLWPIPTFPMYYDQLVPFPFIMTNLYLSYIYVLWPSRTFPMNYDQLVSFICITTNSYLNHFTCTCYFVFIIY